MIYLTQYRNRKGELIGYFCVPYGTLIDGYESNIPCTECSQK